MIVPQRAQAHDLYMAIRFDRQAGFHAEGYLNARRILRVQLQFLDAADLRPARVAHRRAGFQAAGKRKVGAVRRGRAAKCAGEGEDRGYQHGAGDQDKQPHHGLFAFRFHHVPLFPALQRPGRRCSSVSICR